MQMANIMKELSWFWCSTIYDQFNKQKMAEKKAEKRQKKDRKKIEKRQKKDRKNSRKNSRKNASIVLLLSHYEIILFFLPTSISIVFGSIFKYSNLIWIRLHRNEKKVSTYESFCPESRFFLFFISRSLFFWTKDRKLPLSLPTLLHLIVLVSAYHGSWINIDIMSY